MHHFYSNQNNDLSVLRLLLSFVDILLNLVSNIRISQLPVQSFCLHLHGVHKLLHV